MAFFSVLYRFQSRINSYDIFYFDIHLENPQIPMLKDQNRHDHSLEKIGRTFSDIVNQNLSNPSESNKSVKSNFKEIGQFNIQQILNENKFLKEKVKSLQLQILHLKRGNLEGNVIFSPFKKPSKKMQLFHESSLIKIEDVSSIGSAESPAIRTLVRDKRKFSIEKSCSNESLPKSRYNPLNANHLQIFSDSNLLISLEDTDSDGGKNKKPQQMPKSSQAIEDLNGSKNNILGLKLRKCATLNENDDILKETRLNCDEGNLKLPCTQSASQEEGSIHEQHKLEDVIHQTVQEPTLTRSPKNQTQRQIGMIISLPRSDLDQWIDYNLNNEMQSEYEEESDRDSFMEESDVIGKVLVSNNRVSKQSVKGGLIRSSKNTEKSQKKKFQESKRCELIHEQQEHMEKEDHEPTTKKSKSHQENHSLNVGHHKLLNGGRKITEEESDDQNEKSEEAELITKSLAQGSMNSNGNGLGGSKQSFIKKTGIISQKSTYENSENTGLLRFSSKTDKLGQQKEEIKMKKSYVEQNHHKGLEEIKQSNGKECEGSIKKSKSSHNLKKVSVPHQQFDKPKYDMVISKLSHKIKAVSEKNQQLRTIIHRLRHDFYDIHNDQKFKRKPKNTKSIQCQIMGVETCKENGDCDCSFEKCQMKKIPHFQRTKHKMSDLTYESKW